MFAMEDMRCPAVFFANQNEALGLHRRLEENLCHMQDVQGFGGECAWLSRLAQSAHEPTSAR
jgi:hypothetical protein